MNISEQGIDIIKQFEGCRLHAYDDGVGVLTIGYGHTTGVHWGDVITQDEADALLQEDLDDFELCVNNLVDAPLTQPQFDALVSFAFNVGCGALRRSTLLKRLNANDYEGAANQLLRWNRGGGRVLKGLVRRREAERAMFLFGVEKDEPEYPKHSCQKTTLKQTQVRVKDSCVVMLQRALNKWAGGATPLTLDGIFGATTESRVNTFQSFNGLEPDSIVGPKTWAALRSYL